MDTAFVEELRISGRLRDALVADLVTDGIDADYWLTKRLRDPHDWTWHLGRQLGIDMGGAGGLHETLMMFVPELDDLIRTWPLRQDIAWCRDLAHEATKNLLVFHQPGGTWLRPDAVSDLFLRRTRRYGLPRLRLHGLRHTWATLALEKGIHPRVVQERLGHSTIAITLGIYSHVSPTLHDEAADLVAALIL